ncbi:MAG TPA: glycerol-3-phosphate dehydrogenase/oxidase [Thermoleophilaceae bacterium]|nr:glycerol-3-phosphate dehydrogenase/oxidase [Thermoleophilaceae bacterium]
MIARYDALAALEAERFDVVVIGGGITGAGVALDAASRGYSVALVERDDYASGTSSRSSKLVHGGLRYLQGFDVGLVREALLERALMVKLAPHLVKPLAMLVAAFDGRHPDRLVGVALNMYDVMASERLRRRPDRRFRYGYRAGEDWSPDRHRSVGADEVLDHLPALAARRPTGGYLFYDCQTDDVRLTLTVLGEAERFGTVCANRCEVQELVEEGGRAAGVRCVDRTSGRTLEVRAENVVNATGVWADRIRPEEIHAEAEVPRIRPSRGTHVVLADEDLPLRSAAVVPAGGGRTIFALPWLGRTLVGTTDKDYSGELGHVRPDPEDVDYLLEASNRFFATALTRRDVRGAFAGVRPLVSTGDTKRSVDISRKAELFETSSGLITITGGKLTTWRRMAKQVVDRLVERDGLEAPCRTEDIPLGLPVDPRSLPYGPGVDVAGRRLLADRYGYAAGDVLVLAAEDRALARRIVPGLPDVLAEARFAAQREQALSVGDVLLRRTRLGVLDAPTLCAPGAEAPRAVAGALAAEHAWDAARVDREVAAWYAEAAAEGIADAGGDPAPPTGESPAPMELSPSSELAPAPEQAAAR